MDEIKITSRQLVLFAVVLSFVVSVLGTILALGVLGPLFGFFAQTDTSPFVFNRPKIIEKIIGEEKKIPSHEELIIQAVEQTSPAVVSIVATKDVPVVEQYDIDPFSDPFFRQFFGGSGSGIKVPQYRQKGTENREISSGSGFVVSADGMIVTNKHVVADTDAEYTVFLNDGSKKSATILARDPIQDIAILKIEATGLAAVRLADSSRIKIGQTVVAIGNALGEFRNTVSVGVVSGLHRSVIASGSSVGTETLEELIQTDAAINPGNSGGPLLNTKGEVVGVNTAMASGAENIGFSIPINKVKRALESVKQTGRIIYPYLGVRYRLVTKEIAEKEKLGRDYGALVSPSGTDLAVIVGGPAEKAGVKEGDIILTINDTRIDMDHSLLSVIQKYNVGDVVTLKIFREDKEIDLKATLEERK